MNQDARWYIHFQNDTFVSIRSNIARLGALDCPSWLIYNYKVRIHTYETQKPGVSPDSRSMAYTGSSGVFS